MDTIPAYSSGEYEKMANYLRATPPGRNGVEETLDGVATRLFDHFKGTGTKLAKPHKDTLAELLRLNRLPVPKK